MMAPVLTGLSIALLLGILVVVGGVVRLVWAFQAGSVGEGILKFALAGLTLVCGLLLVANPLFASGFLTILLSLYFIVDGISEIAVGIGTKRGWLIFAGVVSILLGSCSGRSSRSRAPGPWGSCWASSCCSSA